MLRRSLSAVYNLTIRESKKNLLASSTCYTNYQKFATNDSIKEKDLKFNTSVQEADIFGTLNPKTITNEQLEDEGDIKEQEFLENQSTGKKLRTTEYAKMIKKFLRKKQIQEAIDVLEVKMLKEDRAKPESYIYNLILGGCGRVGYTKMAFKLFNEMKKRGLEPMGGTYTALFNACANSPWPDDGLLRAKQLKELMFEKGVIPNDTTYNCMIKAFGRCGDMKTAFEIVDEMIQNRIPVKTDVVNFLLQTCISNKKSGFLHALLVWKKFKENKITPDIYSFNLLQHCIRDCGMGDPQVAKTLLEETTNLFDSRKIPRLEELKQIPGPSNTREINNQKNEIIEYEILPPSNTEDNLNKTKKLQKLQTPTSVLNLILDNPYLGSLVDIENVKKPEHRLLLVGGFSGFLNTLSTFNVQPNIKTFSILLDNIPGTLAAEEALLKQMKKHKIYIDIDFLNMLMKKRCTRGDNDGARDVLELFEKYHFRPNIFTYGILSLTCQTLDEARALLDEIFESGYRVNIEILGGLLYQGMKKYNFRYVLEIMEIVIKENVNPSKKFLEYLKQFHENCIKRNQMDNSGYFAKKFPMFCSRYKTWLEEVTPEPLENTHPWEQFRKPVEATVKNYKDPKEYYKPRVSSRFRVKTKRTK